VLSRSLSLVRWLPTGAACVYLVVLIRRLPDIVGQLTWNADYVSSMAMAQSAGTSGLPARAIAIQVGYFWFDLATFGLPAHKLIWEYAPAAMAALTLACVVWTAWRLAGAFAAVLSASLGIAASPLVLSTQVAQAYHGSSWFGIALLSAYLCWLFTARRGRNVVIVVSAAVGAMVGLATASDPLLVPAGDVPFAATFLIVWRAHPDQVKRSGVLGAATVASTAVVVAAAALVGDRLIGFASSFPRGLTHVVTPEHIRGNVQQLIGGVFEVAGMPHAVTALGVVLGLILVTALLLPAAWLIHSYRTLPASRQALIAYWTCCAVFLTAAFVLSDIPADFLENSARYLVPMFYVAVAGASLWAAAGTKRAAAVAVPAAILILANAAAVEQAATTRWFEPFFSVALNEPIGFLERNGLSHGYAAYDEASPISLQSDFALRVYPVTQLFVASGDTCTSPGSPMVCPYAYNSFLDWYQGDQGPTFILIDPDMVRLGQAPPPELDAVTAVYHVGRFDIYVYGDDVVRHMGVPLRFTRTLI
jgi:hypothetical protein